MPKVSVVMPTYNCSEYIESAIESVFEQTYPDYEIVIIDDGSTDGTKETIKHYLKDDRVRYFYQSNTGLPNARNRGLSEARGEYIVFLDADDELPFDALARITEIFVKNGAGWIITDISRREKGVEELQKAKLAGKDYFREFLRQKMRFQSRFYKRETLIDIGLYDPLQIYYEDWDLWIRLLEAGIPFYYINEPLYIYKIRKNSVTKPKKFSKNLYYIERLYKKHYKRLADLGDKEARELYAFYMWRTASDYFYKTGDILKIFRCMFYSVKYDHGSLKRYILRFLAKMFRDG